jgi:hypothetical protein
MAHTYDELKDKTVEELREIAGGLDHEAVKGHEEMDQADLLTALCTALGIEAQAEGGSEEGAESKPEPAAKEPLTGKALLKSRIREFKAMRADALEKKDDKKLAKAREGINRLKRQLRKLRPPKAKKSKKEE